MIELHELIQAAVLVLALFSLAALLAGVLEAVAFVLHAAAYVIMAMAAGYLSAVAVSIL